MTERTRLPSRFVFLLTVHALLSGAFLVAYLTGDEDTYGMHVFAGYTVLAALALRVTVGLFAGPKGPLALPRPVPGATRAWFGRLLRGDRKARSQRSPLLAWMAAALLAATAAAAGSGAIADTATWMEDPHEALGEIALAVVLAHVALIAGLRALKPTGTARPASIPQETPTR